MFDFIFKRSAKMPSSGPVPARQSAPENSPPPIPAARAALESAAAFSGDEAAAVEFILQCQFADARLKAAEHVHSSAMLERVLRHMRNTDRRVTKLMQARLETLKQQEAGRQQAQRCVEKALQLAQEPQLMPNQVADLDRAWLLIDVAPQPLRQQFDDARAVLRERLESQAGLQRAAIDIVARLRHLVGDAPTMPAEAAAAFAVLEREMAQLRVAPCAAALPRHLPAEFEQLRIDFQRKLTVLEQRLAAIDARQEMLSRWEASAPESLATHALTKAWQGLPAFGGDDGMTSLQARFDELMRRVAESRKSAAPIASEATQDASQDFAAALTGMEKALQDGALQAAAEHDRALRAIDIKTLQPSAAHSARLAKARAELSRLQGWAKWGGNVSREELLKAAEELPHQAPAISELAKKVGSLRERWKSLDASAGPANRELWERFDNACSAAYAPAAAHFKKLGEERQHNSAHAQALIDEVRQFVATSGCVAPDSAMVDWKNIANFCTRTIYAWQRLGTIERKEKKRLDSEFGLVMQALTGPLAQQRDIEIKRREQLIAEVGALNPNERTAPDALRALQERWQQQAKSLPLERTDEQALWQRFRGACDAVFAKRKESATMADADRRRNLQAKEAVCVALEAVADMDAAAVRKALHEASAAWAGIGAVARASENRIIARYQSAVALLQKRLDTARQAALQAQGTALRDKLRLCQTAEAAIVKQQPADAGLQERWQAAWNTLPKLPAAFESAMHERFGRALHALRNEDRQYARELTDNRAALSQEVLRCEILSGANSPPELSHARLQLQVEVLQSSLQAGRKPVAQGTQLLRVCSLPAFDESLDVGRIERLIESVSCTHT